MEQNKDFLATRPIGRLLLQLSLPTVAAQLINMLYNVVDRIYIGHIPGEGALALTGVGVCMPLILIISAFAALVGNGGAPRASIALGKKQTAEAEQILGNCFVTQLLVSAVLTAVVLIWNRPLLLAFGASSNTIDYSVAYMNLYALGTVFVQLTLGMNAFITAQGFAKVGMLGAHRRCCQYSTGSAVYLRLPHGCARRRAGYRAVPGTVLPVGAVFLLGKRLYPHSPVQSASARQGHSPCLALGSALFVMQASESVISVCFNTSLLKYGGDLAVGAMTILTSVMQFAMLPLQGLAQSPTHYQLQLRCRKQQPRTPRVPTAAHL